MGDGEGDAAEEEAAVAAESADCTPVHEAFDACIAGITATDVEEANMVMVQDIYDVGNHAAMDIDMFTMDLMNDMDWAISEDAATWDVVDLSAVDGCDVPIEDPACQFLTDEHVPEIEDAQQAVVDAMNFMGYLMDFPCNSLIDLFYQQTESATTALSNAEAIRDAFAFMLMTTEGFAGTAEEFMVELQSRYDVAVLDGTYIEKGYADIIVPESTVDGCDTDMAKADLIAAIQAIDDDALTTARNMSEFIQAAMMA